MPRISLKATLTYKGATIGGSGKHLQTLSPPQIETFFKVRKYDLSRGGCARLKLIDISGEHVYLLYHDSRH